MYRPNLLKVIWQKIYRLWAIKGNINYGKNLYLGIGATLFAPVKLEIGNNVYIGKYSIIECDGKIGDDVLIASNVGLIGRKDHGFKDIGKSMRKASWIGNDLKSEGRKLKLIVGRDCWIGYGSIILTGVEIGRGAIVAAGSVVTKDVKPYTIVAGNPAKKIGMRFNSEEILKHEKIASFF